MFARSCTNGFVRTFALPLSRLATVAGLAMILGPAAYAQEADAERTARKREPIVFTVDVAEDLAGKFVPTMVKPEHTQPERGSFFVTEGRIFPAGTIQGDGANFDPNQTWAHRRVDLPWHAPGGGPRDSRGATLGHYGAAVRARKAGQGAACDRGRGGQRYGAAHRHRRYGQLRRLDRRTAPDLSGLQLDGRGQPARDIHPAAARTVGARPVSSTRGGAAVRVRCLI